MKERFTAGNPLAKPIGGKPVSVLRVADWDWLDRVLGKLDDDFAAAAHE